MSYRALTQDGRYLTPAGRLTYIPEKAFTVVDADGYGMLQRAAQRFVKYEGGALGIEHVESRCPVELVY